MLIGWWQRGRRPVDRILFADPGGEWPHTYRYLTLFTRWLVAHEFPPIEVVRRRTRESETLEQYCLRQGVLPALAYGYKKCSDEFKVKPQDRALRAWSAAQVAWARGGRVIKLVGYHADEAHRATPSRDPRFEKRYPLIEWEWGQEECEAAIREAGLPLPGKSSCFYCPSMRKPEILELRDRHPVLLRRALAIEATAAPNLTSVKGLGRRFNWGEYLETLDPSEGPAVDQPCGCFDG